MKLIITILLCFPLLMLAQDAQYSQFYATSTYLNPAFTGAVKYARITFCNRYQWPNISGKYSSVFAGYDRNFQFQKIGLGAFIQHDRIASGELNKTSINGLASYFTKINGKWTMRSGLSIGFSRQNIGFRSLTFGDQISADFGKINSYSLESLDLNAANQFNLGFGMLFHSKSTWIGFSTSNLTRSKVNLANNQPADFLKISIHGGYTFVFPDNRGLVEKRKDNFSIAYRIKKQGNFNQVDLGVYWQFEPITFGIWYRGIPIIKSSKGYFNQDAIATMIGLKNDKLGIGYSYDLTISALGYKTGGSHEISINYLFGEISSKRKRFKKLKIMYMPTPKL